MQIVEVVKWGNSSAIRLPISVMKQTHISLGDSLSLKTINRKIVLAPATKEYRLEDFLSAISAENQHALVDFGSSVGREVW